MSLVWLAVLVFISMATSVTAQITFKSTGSISFSNGVATASPYPSLIYIGTNGAASLPGTIQAVTVTFNNFSAKVLEDVSVMVEAPNGTAFEVMSGVGGTTTFGPSVLMLSDGATLMSMSGFVSAGTYAPSVYSCGDIFPSPAPAVYHAAATCGTSTFSTSFQQINPNGTWQLFVANQSQGASGSMNSWQLNFTINPPALSVSCYPAGNFYEGETGAQYSVVVSNAGPGPTGGSVPAMVVDTLPTGLTPTAASGPGWNCVVSNQTVFCTATNQTAAGTSYPTLTLTVNVGPVTLASLTNTVTLTGSSDGTHTATGTITINPPNSPNPAPNPLIDANFNTNNSAINDGGFIFGPTMSGAAVLGEAGDQWNGIYVSSGAGIHLSYANGSNSPVTMACNSGGGYNVFSYDGGTPFAGMHYEALMENYLYNGGVPRTITLSGLATNSMYDLVLYNAADTAAVGRTTYFTVNNNTLSSTWDGASSTLIAGTDYVEFPSAVSDGSGNLAITWTGNGTAEGDINGFQIQVTGPQLGIRMAEPGSANIFWPGAGNFVLQSNTNLASTNWSNFNGSVTTANGTNSVTITPATGDVFFRLKQ
jgi:hypothetical protein